MGRRYVERDRLGADSNGNIVMTEKEHLEDAIKSTKNKDRKEALQELHHRLFGYMEADGGQTVGE